MTKTSIWSPLKNAVFRALWLASLLSGSAVSAHEMAATWLINTMTPSPLLISLMSTVATLPFFLFTLPAGAIADMFDRKKLLCIMNLWLAIVAAGLAIATWLRFANPYLILGSVFLLGVGFAVNAPAWTAVIPEVVTKEDLPSAITLGGLQFNISGIIGPAIGAALLPWLGANAVFAINSACFLLVILAVSRWRSVGESSPVPLESFLESFASAIRYVRHTPAVRIVVIRISTFSLFISVIPALLPVIGLKQLHLNASQLGLLFTSLAIGSVLGAVFVVPKMRAKFSPNDATMLATALLILVYYLMGCIRQPEAFLLVAGVGGVAWTVAASELWVAGQNAAPDRARGRLNAIYMMLSNGSMAIGGIVWGTSATLVGLEFTLHIASIVLLISLPVLLWFSIDAFRGLTLESISSGVDLHPGELKAPLPEEGPIEVAMEFQVAQSNGERFLDLLREMRVIYLRNGASSFQVYENLGKRHAYRVEMVFATWQEHLMQEARMTQNEHETWQEVRNMHVGQNPPQIMHYLSVNREIVSSKTAIPGGSNVGQSSDNSES
jgi:MFS family permease